MDKEIFKIEDVESQILGAISAITAPVVQTLSPRGGNVLYQDGTSNEVVVSNDGVNIAKSIKLDNELQQSIVRTIRESALRTNLEAGDGTTTSILLSSVLLREGLKLRRDGKNPMELVRVFKEAGNKLVTRIKEMAKVAENDKEILNIARISANNDDDIANKVLQTIKVAGLDGMVFLEPNNKKEDEIIEDIGFIIKQGLFRPELRTGQGFTANYTKIPVLITDKRLYYKEEAESILRAVFNGGFTEVVIIARDFIGEAVNYFLANHAGGKFKILLVKEPNTTETDSERMEDLSAYLDSKLVSEKNGSIVNKISIKDFTIADKVFSDATKTIIFKENNTSNPRLSMRLSALRAELVKDKNDEKLKERIASLTNGMVTIKVGASTGIELRERLFRFEDAVNASRAAMRHGYLPGGGVALLNAYHAEDYPEEYRALFKKYCESSIRQIAKNCGKDSDTIVEITKDLQEDLEDPSIGFDAMTMTHTSMLQSGIIDPFQVLDMSVLNSISVACNILGVNYFIINKKKEEKCQHKK